MKVTGRIWILALALIFSTITVINADASTKLMIFVLGLLIPVALGSVNSKNIKGFVVIGSAVLIVWLIMNSVQAGVSIRAVDQNSSAFEQGLRQGQIIIAVNNQPIVTVADYATAFEGLFSSGEAQRVDITTDSGTVILFTDEPPALIVEEIPRTNIKTGLDISGGARALVQPDQQITDSQLDDLIAVSRNRFNVFGISDVQLRGVSDLNGNQFMLVEVAGATPDDLESLIAQQGKFEARIGNQTAFVGGDEDITSVCRNDATCASVTGCFQSGGGYACNFAFTIYLSQEAAQRHADITSDISVDFEGGGQYLTENLTLVLDDTEVDALRISRNLQGQVTNQISIQGSGSGLTQQEALAQAQANMNELQTILITGSLPYQLNIVKLDTISPTLGHQFSTLVLLAGGAAILSVGVIIFVRYRKVKLSLALLLTAFSELLIILGIASFIKWNLDLPSIAGILATIGTGVDQQIVILDEARSGKDGGVGRRIKRALFIVMTAYVTSLVSLMPLYWAGAGLFKGFAITSIIGITAGVFITRPAFADIVKKLEV